MKDENKKERKLDAIDMNQHVWVRSKTKKWRECSVLEKDENEGKIKIHFIGYDDKFDEWLELSSKRLELDRPVAGLSLDDDVWVYDNERNTWRKGRVAEVKQDTIKVSYNDNWSKYEWLTTDDPRISFLHKEPGMQCVYLFFHLLLCLV